MADAAIILRQALAGGRGELSFEKFRDGIEIAWLYRNGEHGPAAAFLRYAPGARVPHHMHAGYEHVLVLEGAQSDQNGRHGAGTLVVNPPGTSHTVVSEEGCLVLIIWERPVVFVETTEPG